MDHLPIHNHREYSYLRAYKAPLQLSRNLYKSALFMQNKPNFKIHKMNVSAAKIKDYDNERDAKRPKSKPIQTQYKAKQTQFPKSQQWT